MKRAPWRRFLPGEVTMTERRKTKRVPFSFQVRYKTLHEFYTNFAHDLGERGIFIHVDEPPELFSKVEVEFCPPDSNEVIHVEGEVQRVDPATEEKRAGIYVEFQDLTPEERNRINEIIRHLQQRSTNESND
ncbi:MAG: hypothetical protein D6795_00790 [Deltaproteobacteria bacterium]|nr:MAG: hypothetical protein D6795_00790 [Deltaproteobacteria bacterium]